MTRIVRSAALVVLYLAMVGIATHEIGMVSMGTWVLWALVPVIWLDRWCFGLLAWRAEEALGWEVLRRLSWFAGGFLAFWMIWPGKMAWGELAFLGTELSLATALLETGIRQARKGWRSWRRTGSPISVGWGYRWIEAGSVLAILIVFAPIGAMHPPHVITHRLPSLEGYQVEVLEVPTADGLVLHGWLMTQANARANLVYCHGHKGNCGQVAGFLRHFQALGFNVIACDFRGHGLSPGRTAAFGFYETHDVAAAVRCIREHCPGKPLVMFGVSYGAAVVLQTLPELDNVSAVWVEGAFARFEDVVERFFRPVPQPLQTGLTGFYNGLCWIDCGFTACDINPIERIRDVRVPMHFCHGRLDALIPFENAEELYAAYGGPKDCYWVEGGRHYRLRSDHEKEYFARFSRFIDTYVGDGTIGLAK